MFITSYFFYILVYKDHLMQLSQRKLRINFLQPKKEFIASLYVFLKSVIFY